MRPPNTTQHNLFAFPWSRSYSYSPGLTKREYFALEAQKVIMARGANNPKEVAIVSVNYADALIKELDKEEGT